MKSASSYVVKHWPADRAVLRSMLVVGNRFNCKVGSIAHRLSLLPSEYPNLTEILLKKNVKSQVIHPSKLVKCSRRDGLC